MALPSITQPTFTFIQPSTGKEFDIRRYLVAEERTLLLAKQTEDSIEINKALVQVVSSCAPDLDIANLPTIDFDYLFLQLRSQSVDNIIKVQLTDPDDDEIYKFDINLESVKPPVVPVPPIIELIEGYKAKLRYPTISDMQQIERQMFNAADDAPVDLAMMLIAKCVDSVFDEEQVFQADSDEEMIEFLNRLPSKTFKDIQQFIDTLPEISYTLNYTNKLEEKKEVVLRGIQSFFTF